MEKQLLRTRWDHISKRLLTKWGHRLDPSDLRSSMGYNDLCELLSEACDLKPQSARKELDRIIEEIRVQPSDE